MFGTKKIGEGYKKYEKEAKMYSNHPKKTEQLLRKANIKALARKGALSEVWEKLQLTFSLVQAWKSGEYKTIPTKSIITLIATIIYFVSPIDLVPDFLIGLGIVDDAAVIAFAVKQVSTDLEKFKLWQEKRDNQIDLPDYDL